MEQGLQAWLGFVEGAGTQALAQAVGGLRGGMLRIRNMAPMNPPQPPFTKPNHLPDATSIP